MVLKFTEKKADSGAGSVSQRYGSEDPGPHPDPYQNVSNPENGFLGYILEIGKVHQSIIPVVIFDSEREIFFLFSCFTLILQKHTR